MRIGHGASGCPGFTEVLGWTLAASWIRTASYSIIFKLASVSFGPEGLGQLGEIRFLTAITDNLAAAGILAGINAYVSQFRSEQDKIKLILGTAAAISAIFSLVVLLFLLTAGEWVKLYLLKDPAAPNVVWVAAVAQIFATVAYFLRAVLKGEQDAIGNALIMTIGCFLGLVAYLCFTYLYGYGGALAGIALFPALAIVPALWIFPKRSAIPCRWLAPSWDSDVARNFLKFSFMTAIAVVKYSVIYLVVRGLVSTCCNRSDLGLWQAGNQISDNYYTIVTSSLSIYLLPPLARLRDKVVMAQKIAQTMLKVLLFSTGAYYVIWTLRSHFIIMLHSEEFLGICDLLLWQFTGDIFRGGAAVFASLILAKASSKFYALSEVVCGFLQLILANYLIPRHGLLGASQAHCASHMIYFAICGIFALTLYYRALLAQGSATGEGATSFGTLTRKLWQGGSEDG